MLQVPLLQQVSSKFQLSLSNSEYKCFFCFHFISEFFITYAFCSPYSQHPSVEHHCFFLISLHLRRDLLEYKMCQYMNNYNRIDIYLCELFNYITYGLISLSLAIFVDLIQLTKGIGNLLDNRQEREIREPCSNYSWIHFIQLQVNPLRKGIKPLPPTPNYRLNSKTYIQIK